MGHISMSIFYSWTFFFSMCNWWPFPNKLRLDVAFLCTFCIVKQTVVSILLKKSREMFFFLAAVHIFGVLLFIICEE